VPAAGQHLIYPQRSCLELLVCQEGDSLSATMGRIQLRAGGRACVGSVLLIGVIIAVPAYGDMTSASVRTVAGASAVNSEGKKPWQILQTLEARHKDNVQLLAILKDELSTFRQGISTLRNLAVGIQETPVQSDDKGLNVVKIPGTDPVVSEGAELKKQTPSLRGTPQKALSVEEIESSVTPTPADTVLQQAEPEPNATECSPLPSLSTLASNGSVESLDAESLSESSLPDHVPPHSQVTKMLRVESTQSIIGENLHSITRSMSMEDIVVPETAEAEKPVDEIVCFLDLDKCSIFGQDGNDLPIAMQWMQKPERSIVELYRRLLNPQLKLLYQQLQMQVRKLPVVLYTMRPQLLRYRSACRNEQFLLQWKPEWHHSPDQVVIPSWVTVPEDVLAEYTGQTPLLPQEKTDLFMSFQRLLAIRTVVQEELELAETPTLVVAAAMKDVQGTAIKLGLPPENSYLWDDNEVLRGQPHVLTVEAYTAMDPPRKQEIMRFLNEEVRRI